MGILVFLGGACGAGRKLARGATTFFEAIVRFNFQVVHAEAMAFVALVVLHFDFIGRPRGKVRPDKVVRVVVVESVFAGAGQNIWLRMAVIIVARRLLGNETRLQQRLAPMVAEPGGALGRLWLAGGAAGTLLSVSARVDRMATVHLGLRPKPSAGQLWA